MIENNINSINISYNKSECEIYFAVSANEENYNDKYKIRKKRTIKKRIIIQI